jgi:ankyrin repeat protein
MNEVLMLCALSAFALVISVLIPVQDAASQTPTPQTRLWDGAIAGDTVPMAAALREGARIDSLDTRRNPNGRRALNWAAWYDHPAAIQFLLAHGAPLEARNNTGFTALHHAAESGSVDALRTLLEAGADPRATNRAGRTPLQTARERGQMQAAALLEEALKSPDKP